MLQDGPERRCRGRIHSLLSSISLALAVVAPPISVRAATNLSLAVCASEQPRLKSRPTIPDHRRRHHSQQSHRTGGKLRCIATVLEKEQIRIAIVADVLMLKRESWIPWLPKSNAAPESLPPRSHQLHAHTSRTARAPSRLWLRRRLHETRAARVVRPCIARPQYHDRFFSPSARKNRGIEQQAFVG
jgi:hypothetical protein